MEYAKMLQGCAVKHRELNRAALELEQQLLETRAELARLQGEHRLLTRLIEEDRGGRKE